MFCPNCGKELPPSAAFCSSCGAQLTQSPSSVLERSNSNTPPKGGLDQWIGKNQAYYLEEFRKIEAGQKSKFNWAAFLLGPSMCVYRRCKGLFMRYFLLPMVLGMIGLPLGQIGTGTFNLPLMLTGSILTVGGGIYALISDILFGFHFNKNYWKQCEERMAAPATGRRGVSGKGLAMYYAAMVVYGIISSAIVGGIITNFWTSSLSDPGLDDVSSYIEPDMSWQMPDTLPNENVDVTEPYQVIPEEPTESNEPVEMDEGAFAPFVGDWQDEFGSGFGLWIGYGDETKQQAYAYVATAAGDFEVELKLDESGMIASGVDLGGGSEPLFAIDISRIEYWLEVSLYYGELGFEDYIKFVPADPESWRIENPYYIG